ncbi:MAG: tyrosine recombinase XerC [Ruminococcaceae bacterium]|jgi:site-specific recombinase XerD|nr:tyrosine recombinase XerC [Oscillospiraceae bacterium]
MTEAEFRASFPPVIQDFARYKDVVQGCSKKTVSEYLLDLRTFCRWLLAERNGLPTEGESFESADLTALDTEFFSSVSTGEVYDFLSYVRNGRENESRSMARKLSAIKQFYKFCTSRQHLFENNPAIDIETPKMKKTLPKYLSVDESLSLLDAVTNDTESKTRERDFCILTLFLNCGIRLSELAGISLPDLDRELRSMRVIGKGSKERIVYLNDACRAAIAAYLPVRRETPAKQKGESALFLSGQGRRISVKTVQWMVKKYLGEAGLEYKNYSTHKLRHTAATLMYQSGEVDIRVLKDILGHEQLNTTQIYTHVSNEHMEEAMRNNPLSGVRPKKAPRLKKADELPGDEDPGADGGSGSEV